MQESPSENPPRFSYGSPTEGSAEGGERLRDLDEFGLSPDIQETPPRGIFVNTLTGEARPFLGNGPDTDEWVFLSPDPTLSIEEVRDLVAQGGFNDLSPDQVTY